MLAYLGAVPLALPPEATLRKGYHRDQSPSAVPRQDRIQ
jgi:hypothetical protein